MPFPLLLGLGILAANQFGQQYFKDRRDAELAGKLQGLLGAAPGPMGPPDESGQMGMSPGRGLLADPKDVGRQMEFASGLAAMPGQMGVGLQMLNAAFGRSQQEAERAQMGDQFNRNFDRQVQQFEQTFGANREDAANAEKWRERTFGASREDAAENRREFYARFGLDLNADRRAENADRRAQGLFDLESAGKGLGVAGAELPKLPAGWMYQQGADGGAIAAPVRGTTDWTKGVDGMESLQSADDRVGKMIDLIEGKERTTPAGNKVRTGGQGSEYLGEKAAQYSVLRGQILSDLGKQRMAGVIDQKEYERLSDQLPDPTSLGSYFTFNSTMAGGYKELRQQIKENKTKHLRANPWLVPAMPRGFEPVTQ